MLVNNQLVCVLSVGIFTLLSVVLVSVISLKNLHGPTSLSGLVSCELRAELSFSFSLLLITSRWYLHARRQNLMSHLKLIEIR